MKRYSIIINSLVFIVALILSISIIKFTLETDHLKNDTQANTVFRVVNIGEVQQVKPYSFIFKYNFEGNTWHVEIKMTDATKFHTSKLLMENGIVYGREVRESGRNELFDGKKVVVDWELRKAGDFIATDIIFVEPGATSLIY